MAYSYVDYVGDGVVKNFSVPFPYLEKNDVIVYVQGITKTQDTHYTWLTDSAIQFVTAPADEELIRIERQTDRGSRHVDYQAGNILKEETLDLDSNQLFYLMQEAFDWIVKAQAIEGAVFADRDAIKDALLGQLDKSHFGGDLYHAQHYIEQEYLYDAIYQSGDEVYDHGIFATAGARLDVVEGEIELAITDIEGNAGEISLLTQEFMVKLDANGYVTGFGLYNDGAVSSFVVNADYFGVIKADGTGGVKTPFIVDVITGNIAIDGNLMVSGSITGTKIAANTIEADNIVAGTITGTEIGADAIKAAHILAGEITLTHINATTQNDILNSNQNWNDISNTPAVLDAASGAGLYTNSSYTGYYDGLGWKTYMDSSGNFYLGGTGGALVYTASTGALAMEGSLTVSSNDGITIENGGDLTLTGDDSDPAKIIFEGTSYSVEMKMLAGLGTDFRILPTDAGYTQFRCGDSTYTWNDILLYSEDSVNIGAYKTGAGGGIAGLAMARNGTSTFSKLECSYDGGALKTAGIVYNAGSTGNFAFACHGSKGMDQGWSGRPWDTIFADDFTNVADFYWLDEFDDLAELHKIKPRGVRDKKYNLEMIDDDTLPEFMVLKEKDGTIARDPDGNPYVSLKVAISHLWGCVRQLDNKHEDFKAEVMKSIGDN